MVLTPLEFGNKLLKDQTFSVLLGSELTAISHGASELTLITQKTFNQNNGFIHGGVLSYLADCAITFAGGSVLGPDVVTSEYKINYLKPAIGKKLIAKATVLSSGKRQATCECKIFVENDDGEKLVAVALGTIVKFEQ